MDYIYRGKPPFRIFGKKFHAAIALVLQDMEKNLIPNKQVISRQFFPGTPGIFPFSVEAMEMPCP